MNDPSVFAPSPRPEPESEQEPNDWRVAAPKWALQGAIFLLAAIVGGLGTALMAEKSDRQKRIEAAIDDSPTKYQSRLTERVAILETQSVLLINAVDKLTGQYDRQAAATNKLTIQLEILTAELKHQRR